jgi:hypothetical protein
MGGAYWYLDDDELAEYDDRFTAFLEDAYTGTVTLNNYRDSVPDQMFIDQIMPDDMLARHLMVSAVDDRIADRVEADADWQELRDDIGNMGERPQQTSFEYDIVIDKLQAEDKTIRLHGTDLAEDYLAFQDEQGDASRIGKYMTAFSRALRNNGYDRATPTGLSVDELADEQQSLGAWVTSAGKVNVTFGTGALMMVAGAFTGDPALHDAGLAAATVAAGGAAANVYYTGREERYDEAIASTAADRITEELGSYEVDVVESYPFRLIADS